MLKLASLHSFFVLKRHRNSGMFCLHSYLEARDVMLLLLTVRVFELGCIGRLFVLARYGRLLTWIFEDLPL